MELRDWAERILDGDALDAHKLWFPPEGLTDRAPGPPQASRPPARPPGLALDGGGTADGDAPGAAALHDPAVRVRLLHAFANHELLALELMALVLLRFPDAPRAFRMGTARVMRDEQRHLAMYRGRIQALGGQLGDHALSDFFWRALHDVPSLPAFVARMGLVLEQANLDWCRHWGPRFAAAGDPASAALIAQVHADEVGHVAHALRFHRAWKPPETTDWQAFVDQTAPPMGAGRARGPVFDRAARAAAGLDPDFIARVEHLGQSKGRPPVVWLFDPTVEESLADGRPHWTPRAPARALAADLAALPGALAAAGDAVVVPAPPAPDWLAHRSEAGLPPVEHLSRAAVDRIPRVAALAPWGWSPRTRQALAGLAPVQPPPGPVALHRKDAQCALMPALLDACRGTLPPDWLLAPEDLPRVVHSAAAARARAEALWAAGDVAVLKAPLGAAGRSLRRWGPGDAPGPVTGWIDRVLAQQGALTVGPWLERLADLSFHGDLRPAGGLRWVGRSRFLADGRGVFRGIQLGRAAAAGPPALRRFLAGGGQAPRWLDQLGRRLLTALLPHLPGHHGPLGVDALVCRRGGALRLWPLVELNPRWTMGRVGLALAPLLHSGVHATWLLLPARGPGRPAPGAPLPAPERGPSGRLRDGLVWTTDPRCAHQTASVLVVAPTAPALAARLAALGAGPESP